MGTRGLHDQIVKVMGRREIQTHIKRMLKINILFLSNEGNVSNIQENYGEKNVSCWAVSTGTSSCTFCLLLKSTKYKLKFTNMFWTASLWKRGDGEKGKMWKQWKSITGKTYKG